MEIALPWDYEKDGWPEDFDDSDLKDQLEMGSDGLLYSEHSSDIFTPAVATHGDVLTELATRGEAFVRGMSSHWMQVPLSAEVAAAGPSYIGELSDEELLVMPAILLVHIQRTSSQNGVQVISPRQVPLGGIAGRVDYDHRTPDMFVVGSNATRTAEWPVVCEPVSPDLFDNEPLDAQPYDSAPRDATDTDTLLDMPEWVTNPVKRAIMKGQALVDLMRRPDIGGPADALADLLAESWGLTSDMFNLGAGASITANVSLLRYAIGIDSHYPTIYAPVQDRKVISVAAMSTGRAAYGEFAALDWRRMRVFCESVFYMSARLEGWTMTQMSSMLPVGNPLGEMSRRGLLKFRPLPGAVWCFDPGTFALSCVRGCAITASSGVRDMAAAAAAEMDGIEYMATSAIRTRKGLSFSAAIATKYEAPSGDVLVQGYERLLKSSVTFQAKGKTANSAVRGYVYACLEATTGTEAIEGVWVTRAVADLARELGVGHMLDLPLARSVASRMSWIGPDIRQKLVVEAERRGDDLETWWYDFSAQLPMDVRMMSEGTAAWTIGLSWMLMRQPSKKWISLSTALAAASHRALAVQHLASMMLPSEVGSQQRVDAVVETVARRLARTYGAYYYATADAAFLLATRYRRAGDMATYGALRTAGLMWDIRSKAVSTLRRTEADSTGTAGVDASVENYPCKFTCAPYKAYDRFRKSCTSLGITSVSFPENVRGAVSEVFRGLVHPLMSVTTISGTRIARYLDEPDRLRRDIEQSLAEFAHTVRSVAQEYLDEGLTAGFSVGDEGAVLLEAAAIDIGAYKPRSGTLWDLITRLDEHDAVWIAEVMQDLPGDVCDELESRTFSSPEEMRDTILKRADRIQKHATTETVT
jgi:hypothetical protein